MEVKPKWYKIDTLYYAYFGKRLPRKYKKYVRNILIKHKHPNSLASYIFRKINKVKHGN